MAVIEKKKTVEEIYLITICDECGSENVTTYSGEMALCGECGPSP